MALTDTIPHSGAAVSRVCAVPVRQYRAVLTALMVISLAGCAGTSPPTTREDQLRDGPETAWVESEIQLPAMPLVAHLLPFHVNAAATQQFAVDGTSLTLGSDNVVRFTLVTRSLSGASNISYEGIRCATRESKLYAIGRADGTWSPVRRLTWQPFNNEAINRQQAALAQDYLCVQNAVAGRPGDMVRRLQRQETMTQEMLR